MKTKEELNALKQEVEALNRKLHELTEEELVQVTGGNIELEIKNLAKKYLQSEEKGFGDAVKDSLEKYANYYESILPKK